MKKTKTAGSLFAGIGGFDLGLEQAGWQIAWQVEKDEFCRRVLAKHWPRVPRHDDVCTFAASRWLAVDLITAGFPCQDLSLAGRRKGFSGERSALFWEAVRIIKEGKPNWILFENVPGMLSSRRGEDFTGILDALEGVGYGLAWGTLNTLWFGLPQNRRRVFLVGRFGRCCPPEVLAPPSVGGTCRNSGDGSGSHARTIASFYGELRNGRESAHFAPNGTYIRAYVDPDRVREVARLPRGLDLARYTALGNAVSVPVARYIGQKLLKYWEKEEEYEKR